MVLRAMTKTVGLKKVVLLLLNSAIVFLQKDVHTVVDVLIIHVQHFQMWDQIRNAELAVRIDATMNETVSSISEEEALVGKVIQIEVMV
ncbi:hypothetical protein GCK72_018301 [Caenorhabditis remanei]|uniref:Uncharacterized protein n=1 Tax=Caenorhabditis remanei TaxID=31234 RepID=A0A6A5G9G8_CAERE|nr:hypothetical protein GCK72_018301 [Caenorhabditis remanei]KAF1751747.1 hypothetical protein GCK72_018301 [Caenorhabditis remanei]